MRGRVFGLSSSCLVSPAILVVKQPTDDLPAFVTVSADRFDALVVVITTWLVDQFLGFVIHASVGLTISVSARLVPVTFESSGSLFGSDGVVEQPLVGRCWRAATTKSGRLHIVEQSGEHSVELVQVLSCWRILGRRRWGCLRRLRQCVGFALDRRRCS